jgi:hypothetical protein
VALLAMSQKTENVKNRRHYSEKRCSSTAIKIITYLQVFDNF